MMNEPVTLPHVKAGKLVLLAINGPIRNPDFPDVPTLTEAGITGADVPIWFGFYGPAGLPKEIVTKLNAKIVELAKNEDFKKTLERQRDCAGADARGNAYAARGRLQGELRYHQGRRSDDGVAERHRTPA